jgi:hypothetical protein
MQRAIEKSSHVLETRWRLPSNRIGRRKSESVEQELRRSETLLAQRSEVESEIERTQVIESADILTSWQSRKPLDDKLWETLFELVAKSRIE